MDYKTNKLLEGGNRGPKPRVRNDPTPTPGDDAGVVAPPVAVDYGNKYFILRVYRSTINLNRFIKIFVTTLV